MRHHLMVHTIFMVILAVMGPVRATRREKHKNHRVEVNENLYADPCSAERYEDDIAVDQETKKLLETAKNNSRTRGRRAATAYSSSLWRHGVIPFVLDSSSGYTLAEQAVILRAIRNWEKHTCLTFIPRRGSDRNYVSFYKGTCGCCSFVGVQAGKQGISIGPSCYTEGIVVHEIGHAIGYWHEHTRPDRDKYIDVIWDNIKDDDKHNFVKQESIKINSHGEAYDYESIMHYGPNTFSKSSQLQTIRPFKKNIRIGQRERLSAGDIRQTNKMYQCPVCGDILASSNGEFYSPKTASSTTCVWRIRVEKGYYIKLRLVMSPLGQPGAGHCLGPYVDVKETVVSQLQGRYCVDGKTHTIESNSSHLYVSFTHDLRNPSRGFTASYTTTCNKNFTAASGLLESPRFPNYYPHNIDCVWVITGQGKISISFDVFHLEDHSECVYDYVEFRDGDTINSKRLQRLCGGTPPEMFRTSSNKLFVHFKTDSSIHKTGFSMRWQSDTDECATDNRGGCEQQCINFIGSYRCACNIGYVMASDNRHCNRDCGGVLTDRSGVITSPNFPGNYPDHKQCHWQIELPAGETVDLSFKEFDVEAGGATCMYDSVNVYNGTAASPQEVGKYCNGQYPPAALHLANWTRVVFKTDGSATRKGFELVYHPAAVDECKSNNGACQMICVDKVVGHKCHCSFGYRLNEDARTCTVINQCLVRNGGCQMICLHKAGGRECQCHPGYQLNPDGRTCRVTNQCLVNNGDCQTTCTLRPNQDHLCGCSAGYKLNSDGRTCSDVDECIKGSDGCDHTCVNTIGSFHCSCPAGYGLTSNGISCIDIDECASPQHNDCSQICENLRGSFRCSCFPGYKMKKKGTCKRINYCKSKPCEQKCINMGTTYRCECYEGYKLSSDGNHCEDINECAGPDKGNCSDTCVNYPGGYNCSCPSSGFVLRRDRKSCFRCSGNMPYGVHKLGLPLQVVITDKGAECLWLVKVDPGQRVKLTIDSLPESNCSATQIQVLEPSRQLCYSEGSTGTEVVSSANEIKLSLQSEQVGHQLNGYLLATFSSVCGGSLKATSFNQTIYSHNGYGRTPYPAHSKCVWIVTAENDSYQVHIESNQFALEKSNRCHRDYLEVDRFRYCGNKTIVSYNSMSQVHITFHSDSIVEDVGFNITYYSKERRR